MLRSSTTKRTALVAVAVGGALIGLLVAGLGAAQDGQSTAPVSFAGPPSFADVIEQVSPAVVNIAVTKQPIRLSSGQGGTPFAGAPFEEFFEQFGFGGPQGRMPAPAPQRGEGSGFIIDADGYIATNNHVVDGASEVVVRLKSGEELAARVVGTDERTDLALLKVEDRRNLPVLNLGDSDQSRVGDWVLAIGNPFGLGGSATAGIISARGRDIQSGPYDDFLQIDAPINAGNSGGPVFNARGEVIGINTAIFSPNGGNIGIGFAIPSNQARSILNELREGGIVSRGWLGVEIQSVERATGGNSLPNGPIAAPVGARIARVVANGPAESAGLQSGDIITRFDGQTIDTARSLSRLVGNLDAGSEVSVEYQRDGQLRETTTVLGALDESEMRAFVEPIEPADPGQRGYQYYRFAPDRR
jgi:serine protease Do